MLINHSFNFGQHTTTVRETAMHSEIAQCCNCWLGVARPIPSLTLLKRQLQMVHLVLTLLSV